MAALRESALHSPPPTSGPLRDQAGGVREWSRLSVRKKKKKKQLWNADGQQLIFVLSVRIIRTRGGGKYCKYKPWKEVAAIQRASIANVSQLYREMWSYMWDLSTFNRDANSKWKKKSDWPNKTSLGSGWLLGFLLAVVWDILMYCFINLQETHLCWVANASVG